MFPIRTYSIHRVWIIILIALLYFPAPQIYTQYNSLANSQIALSQPLTVKWLYNSELTINLNPATDGERIYLPLATGILVSLQAENGQLLWKADLGGELSASPLADERSIYIASETFGEQGVTPRGNGTLRALGQEGGITHWMRQISSPIRGSLIANDVNLFGGSTDGKIYAVRKKTGDISWVMQHSSSFTSHPVIFGSNLYMGSNDGYMFSLKQNTGKVIWRYRTRGSIRGQALALNGTVYFGSADGYVYAVRETDGRLKWRRRMGGGVQTVGHAQNGLLVASLDNFAYLLSFTKGDRLWKRQLAGRLAAQPLIMPDGVLFTPLSSSTGVVLDLLDGKQLNSLPIGEDNSMAVSPIAAGKTLAVTTRHGLIAFSRPG
jgi:outer membrane protein assembly factor BamB